MVQEIAEADPPRSRPLLGNATMGLAALIWGFAFVAQKNAMSVMGPFTFSAARFALGASLLWVVWAFWLRRSTGAGLPRAGLPLVLAMGVALFGGVITQQISLVSTTASKAALITGMYIVFVPLLLRILGTRLSLRAWVAIAISFIGLYVLSVPAGEGAVFSRIERGDYWVLASAILFSVHILVVDRASRQFDPVVLSIVQFYICAGLSALGMLIWEAPSWTALSLAWEEIFYAGALSVGVAYTLQVVGQRHVAAHIASMVLSLEIVFGVLGGSWLLGEVMTPRMQLGAVLMLLGLLLVQLPGRKKPGNPPR